MIDEGYIKFNADWKETAAFEDTLLTDLIAVRQLVYEQGFIGVYPDEIGFGNISMRLKTWEEFYISGSKTGAIPIMDSKHIAKVTEVQVHNNCLSCIGPVIASSESMTHASVYRANPTIGAVIHIHSKVLWDRHKFKLPTTSADTPYGTVEMAAEVFDLVCNTGEQGILVMAGHEEGLIIYGKDLYTTYQLLQTIV